MKVFERVIIIFFKGTLFNARTDARGRPVIVAIKRAKPETLSDKSIIPRSS